MTAAAQIIGAYSMTHAPCCLWAFQFATFLRIGGDFSVLSAAALPIWKWNGLISGILHLTFFLLYILLTLKSALVEKRNLYHVSLCRIV